MTLRKLSALYERCERGTRHRTAFLVARRADRKRARRINRTIVQEHLDG